LKIDGHGYSPTILHRILHMVAVTDSYDVAATALEVASELSISSREVNKLATAIGTEMAADRDARTRQYMEQPLPRKSTEVDVRLDLAAVFCDGGRMRTRQEGQGVGVHQPHWRETKNAGFHRMQSQTFDEDPQPELPECFRNQAYVEKLVKGLKSLKTEGREDDTASSDPPDELTDSACVADDKSSSWQPETVFRTCVSSLADSTTFGPMMAAEADRRGFYTAAKQAFLGDGLAYNWTIQRRWFPTFIPIGDFVHVVEYAYTMAKAIHHDVAARWQQYLAWVTACWQGRVGDVIEELRQWQARLGPPADGEPSAENDPRRILQSTVTYLTNNTPRMDYPRYRRTGLPVTSSQAESLVKQISKRVKGTEKFFNDGAPGEAILQLRAAILCDDVRLETWIRTRPISPFSPRCRAPSTKISA
jgi:hypothetical protein